MWIPFLFLIGIISIVLIARYNEDDRLFWKLLLSFVFAFTATTIGCKMFGWKNKDMEHPTEQVYPTQASPETLNFYSFSASELITITDVTDPVPVSKDYTPAFCKDYRTFNEVYGHNRDQPPIVDNFNLPCRCSKAFEIDSS